MFSILSDRAFVVTLCELDFQIAEWFRQQGCRFCSGRLHSARYPRKPRFTTEVDHSEWTRRWSFCCAREKCRRRTTPPSMRFLGRRVWPGVVVVIVSALDQVFGSEEAEAKCRDLGMAKKTVSRWRDWWRDSFPRSPLWYLERSRFSPPPPKDADLPAELISRFGQPSKPLTHFRVLQFLLPLTMSFKFSNNRDFLRGVINPQRMSRGLQEEVT